MLNVSCEENIKEAAYESLRRNNLHECCCDSVTTISNTNFTPFPPTAPPPSIPTRLAARSSTSTTAPISSWCPSSKQRHGSNNWLPEVKKIFHSLPGGVAKYTNFKDIVKAMGLPLYWKYVLYLACGGERRNNCVSFEQLCGTWLNIYNRLPDRHSQFMALITSGKREERNRIEPSDWDAFMLDIVNTHPGLEFLKNAKEFISRYCKTVISRIYFSVNRSWSGKITCGELRHSNLLEVIDQLEYECDINKLTDYFSYEHFYVIYCKFWDIDTDHDLLVTKTDLYEHNNRAVSKRIIDRVFSGAVSNTENIRQGSMSYSEFVWFIIAEEDKLESTSIEYWFRCMDMDGDGFLSMYELEYFYEEQIQQLEKLNYEFMQFDDLICQMLDMIKPNEPNKIRLMDLKRCKMANLFFDTFINIQKYLDHEQKDPFAEQMGPDRNQISDWVRFAAEEYDNLIREDQLQNSTTTGDDDTTEKDIAFIETDDEPRHQIETHTHCTGKAVINFSNL